MSGGKQLMKRSTSCAENNPRCETENEEKSTSCGRIKKLFNCCSKKAAKTDETPSNLSCNDYDYIVEKLVIKRVPITLFATPYDVYRRDVTENSPETFRPASAPQKVYPIFQTVNPSLFYTSANSNGPPDFRKRPSDKTLRFTRNDNFLVDDALNATTCDYSNVIKSRFRDMELLDRFTALHPNLKESERAPKDPCPLNIMRNRRSLAEEMSEIAAKKGSSPNLRLERTAGSVYTAEPGTSGVLSSLPTAEIPTRDKVEEIPNRYATGSSSCFPFGWRSVGRDEETEADALRTEDSLTGVPDVSGPPKNKNYIIAPVQVHYASPNLVDKRKMLAEERHRTDDVPGNKEKLNVGLSEKGKEKVGRLGEPSTDDEISEASEEPTIGNLARATIRWRIVIKNHPPAGRATSCIAKVNSQPVLGNRVRDAIEAHELRDAKNRCNKWRDELPKRTL